MLPAQPAVGQVQYVPLGGDGFRAPFAAYAISSHTVAGDAGGGFAQLRISMDPRFCSLVAWTTIGITQVTPADAVLRGIVGSDGLEVARLADQATEPTGDADINTQTILRT